MEEFLVQQAQAEPQPAAPEADPNAFEIIDETQPAQLEAERRVMAGETVSESPTREGPPAEEAVETAAEAPAETPTVETPPQPQAEAKPPEPPQPRTYTEDEVAKIKASIQSAKDKQIAEARRRAQEAQQRLSQQNLEAQVEGHLRAQEVQLMQTLSADEARKMVRSPENTKYVRDAYTSQYLLQELATEQQRLTFENEASAMAWTAKHFADKHHVPVEDVPLLMNAPTPEKMETLAKRLSTAAQARGQSTQERRNLVPRETPQTQPESGAVSAAAPESEDRRITRLNNTPSWDWSDADIRFMREGR